MPSSRSRVLDVLAVFFGGAIIALATSCASRSTSMHISDAGPEQWVALKEIGDDVATRYGFVADVNVTLEDPIEVSGGWLAIASYSNIHRGGV